jgi:polyhydroxyalkanoate synthesis regulator phasin
MSNKDEFELDVEETVEDEFDDAALEEAGEEAEEAPAKKKKSGGGLTVFAVLLLLLGGGGFAAVKFLGVELPFNIPGLTVQAEHPAQNETTQMTASADLPAADLPPQPEAPVSGLTQTGSLPIGIDASEQTQADEMAAAAEADPWGVATDTHEAVAVDPFAHTGQQQPAETSAVVDPFAFDVADVTAEVAEKGEEALDAAKEVIQDAAKNAKDVAETAAEAVKEEIADPLAALGAPKQEEAPDAQTSAAAPVDAAPAAVQPTESSVAPAAEVAPPVPEQSVETVKAVAPKPVEEPKAAKVEEKKQAEPKKAAEPSKEVSKPKEAAKPAAPARKIDWVLRSAKPGTALVSERGSNEMRTVAVGDTLSGIGKVTAITTDSQGRWVVSGTRGSIKQ